MKLGIMPGSRYYRVGDNYYCTSAFHSEMWKECLRVFDEVVVMDRTVLKNKVEAGFKTVLAEKISFIPYPNFFGFLQLLFALPKMFIVAKEAARKADVWHISSGSIPSFCLWFWLWFYEVPYSIELRGEQGMNIDYLRKRGVVFPWFVAACERLVLWLERTKAIACVGVAKFLAEQYGPLNKDAPRFVISDSRIPRSFQKPARRWSDKDSVKQLLCVGNVEAVKNPEGLIRACGILNKKMTNWCLVWVGKGPLIPTMERLAKEIGISEKVKFLGFVPWQDIFGMLEKADLFVFNSVSEGMPRAILEAMTSALPIVATNVGGIREVLNKEDIVFPYNDEALANKIYEILSDTDRMTEMSKRNVEMAKNFSAEVLSEKKIEFYRWLRTFIEERYRRLSCGSEKTNGQCRNSNV